MFYPLSPPFPDLDDLRQNAIHNAICPQCRCKSTLKYISKGDVSRAVGIPSSRDSGHQGTQSPLHEILVGIPSSGDSV